MKRILGIVLGILIALVALAGGLYVGGWLFFGKAIVDIIEAIKDGWVAIEIAKGLTKIFIGIPAVGTIAGVLISAGMILASEADIEWD